MNLPRNKSVCVVVLGDVGRSPRMQYHSLSLAESGYNVNIVGYNETSIQQSLMEHSNIAIHFLTPFPTFSIPILLNYVLKTIWQSLTLLFALMFKSYDFVLVQNPPAVPTLFICWLYCFFARARFVIDWHNYAHTRMALSLRENHPLVKITKMMESVFGRKAHSNLCVTNAMKDDLKANWGINSIALYDKPPRIFRPISIEEKHRIIMRLSKQYFIFRDENNPLNTALTEINSERQITLKQDRPALLISSTSWTDDEDFSVLLNALQHYENSCSANNPRRLPKLICVITGKGPLKDYYLSEIDNFEMQHVQIVTPWLEASEYPLILASADLGVCLHASTSGLDLPMKVVDMFGCCLPVCAYDYNCLNELVKHGLNSYVFKDFNQLATQLLNWFDNFPNNKIQQEVETRFKQELNKFQNVRWEENWTQNALPIFK